MNVTKVSKPHGKFVRPEEKPLPSVARFAISAMNGKFQVPESQLKGKFMDGLLALVQNDSMCALEKLLSPSGSMCLKNALTIQMDEWFWTQYVVPLLEALSMDELQLGCRQQLTTAVFQKMFQMPFFPQKLAEFIESDVVDPVLALSIVDRAGTGDKSFMQDSRFINVVQVLGTKLSGQMREHLLCKFKTVDDISVNDTNITLLQDTTVQSLRELKFDRHDNDFESIAQIELIPTKQELESTRPPYLPLASSSMSSPAALFETHFRWLREDLVAPIRESVALLRSQEKDERDSKNDLIFKRLRSLTFGPTELEYLHFDKYTGTGFVVSFPHPCPFKLTKLSDVSEVKVTALASKHYDNYWKERPYVFRRGAVVAFVTESDGELVRFGEVLHGNSPNEPLKTNPEHGTCRVAVRFEPTQFAGVYSDMITERKGLLMVQLQASFFAYKPILRRLQQMKASDIISKLLPGNLPTLARCYSALDDDFKDDSTDKILRRLNNSKGNIMSLLPHSGRASLTLDKQQSLAVELAFSTPVSLIQGPPGTGKSLCGAVIGAILHHFTKLRVLCLCFTNHALDDFLEDLIKIGIPDTEILRIGSGCCADPDSPLGRTRLDVVKNNFAFPAQRPLRRLMASTHQCRDQLEEEIDRLQALITQMGRRKWKSIKEYLFKHDKHALAAFTLNSSDGFRVAGSSESQLWEDWISGKPVSKSVKVAVSQQELWTLPKQSRNEMLAQWIKEVVSQVEALCAKYDSMTARLQELYEEATSLIIQSRRIIGCTTTGASSFSRLLDGTTIDVLIMEEAGEILEAHSIAAIGRQVSKIVLIGDHLQLRPKIGNHLLGVELSEGRYALDISLFERLIENGVQRVTLEQQHRMCPSIATFVTQLSYPSLRTAATVQRRKPVGVPHNVMFVNHSELEDSEGSLQNFDNAVSHTNLHEVKWVLAITRYLLCQSEYCADDIVVLTPYLGQAVLLRRALSELSNASVKMNERDIADLIKAGKDLDVSENNGNGNIGGRKIRVSTVDNFQGEEGNIVIASLVRSNERNAIGFVAQPQRMNVLLSRAKEAMILVGNASTLMDSKKGGERWKKVIEIFKEQGTVDQGITLSCPRHETVQLIRSPDDFAEKAPHGGCDRVCDTQLKCGHSCQWRCHRGPCSDCLECERQKQLKREQEEILHKRKELLIRNQKNKEKLQHDLDQKREHILLKQNEICHSLEIEKLNLQKKLLEKESKLIEMTTASNLESKIQNLRKKHKEEVRALEARFASQPVGSSEQGKAKASSEQSERADDTQRDANIHGCSPVKVRSTAKAPLDATGKAEKESSLDEDDATMTPEGEWKQLRLKVSFDQRKSMDALMKLIGLQAVKKIALEVFKKELADQQLKVDGLGDRIVKTTLNFAFVGNPGTGKTTVAQLFTGILVESGVRKVNRFETLTASELLRLGEEKFAARISSMCGVDVEKAPPLGDVLRRNLKVEVQGADKRWYPAKVIDEQNHEYTVEYSGDGSEEKNIKRSRIRAGSEIPKKGGVLFIDEAYDLTPNRNSSGAAIVNMLMESAEKHRDKLTIILAGYQKDIEEQLFAFNDGMPSRFREVVFDDFDEKELQRIWDGLCRGKEYISDSKVTEVAARHVARGRGVRGFGNARSVRSLFEQACARSLQNRVGSTLRITAEDVLGLRPSLKGPKITRIMEELNGLIGLPRAKESLKSLIALSISNYDREMKGLPSALVPLNRVFVGNPGTGKTTVARLYGALLKALGLLSNGEVVFKVASDLMGQYIGQAQQQTRAILENAKGKVLLIDEAYGLDEKFYGKQALDTIVERVSGAPGEDIAVVLVGYEKEIRNMIDNQNPGLKRRFNMDICKVVFDDLTDDEIHTLIGMECRRAGVAISDEAHAHATRMLVKQRSKPNFGNAGNVKALVKTAVARLTSEGPVEDVVLSVREIDPNFEPDADPLSPLYDLEDTSVKEHLMELALQLQVREKEGRSTEGLLGHYVFTGAPGTGKTTIARKLAKVLFNMRVLASDLVVETSSSDLIGSFIGHSRKNVEDKMKEARGGVCFIDEAYHLGVGPFGSEAMTQLLTMLTLPEYMDGKTIVVLAGYENEIHQMLESNPGLKSRFSSYLRFQDWASEKCVSFCCKLAAREQPQAFTLDNSGKAVLRTSFEEIRSRPGWANARDVIQLYKQIISARDVRVSQRPSSTIQTDTSLIATEDIEKAVHEMLMARPAASVKRKNPMNPWSEIPVQLSHLTEPEVKASPHIRGEDSMTQEEPGRLSKPTQAKLTEAELTQVKLKRDVPDEVERQEDEKNPLDQFYTDLLKEVIEVEKTFADNHDDAYARGCAAERDRLTQEKQESETLLKEKKLALERVEAAKEERERQRLREEARKKEEELQRRHMKEAQRQQIRRALMSIGKCVEGFVWLRQGHGFRCAGGGQFASFKDIAVKTGLTVEEIQDAFKK